MTNNVLHNFVPNNQNLRDSFMAGFPATLDVEWVKDTTFSGK